MVLMFVYVIPTYYERILEAYQSRSVAGGNLLKSSIWMLMGRGV